jgi:hypothetical protein
VTSKANVLALGSSSCRRSSLFDPNSAPIVLNYASSLSLPPKTERHTPNIGQSMSYGEPPDACSFCWSCGQSVTLGWAHPRKVRSIIVGEGGYGKAGADRGCGCFRAYSRITGCRPASHRTNAAVSRGSSPSSRLEWPLSRRQRWIRLGRRSSSIVFTGDLAGGTTTPLGRDATELTGTTLLGSGSLSGALAGGQIGFNWQAGMVVFGAEVDAQWLGQQGTSSVVCNPGCTASEVIKIRSLTTGRARPRLGL